MLHNIVALETVTIHMFLVVMIMVMEVNVHEESHVNPEDLVNTDSSIIR